MLTRHVLSLEAVFIRTAQPNRRQLLMNRLNDYLIKSLIKQTGVIKDLQSKQEYHLSEKHISQMIRNKMEVTTPQPIIIIVPEEMAVNE